MKFSIILPNYNYAHFLEQAVQSIFQYRIGDHFEIILIDDASGDHSPEVIRGLMRSFPCIRLIRNRKNLGAIPSINLGVRHAQGEYLHFFSADDLYLPHAMEKMMECVRRHPDISLFASPNCFFSDPDAIHSTAPLPANAFHFYPKQETYLLFRHTDFYLAGHTVFMKRSAFERFGPLHASLSCASDWYLNHKIAFCEGFGFLPDGLCAQRIHSRSLSSTLTHAKKREIWKELLHLLEKEEMPKAFCSSGIMRMLGLKAIMRDLILTPKYWKHLWPLFRKLLNGKSFQKKRLSL